MWLDEPRLNDASSTEKAEMMKGVRIATFEVGGEAFAFEIDALREITRLRSLTPLPNVPEFVEGLMNLRGSIVPIIDLSCLLGLPLAEKPESVRVIILSVTHGSLGVIVDSVGEIFDVSAGALSAPGRAWLPVDEQVVRFVADIEDSSVFVLNVRTLFTRSEAEDSDVKTPDLARQWG